MTTIGNNANTLLHGLSDFWLRFYADTEELQAIYHGTELLLAQTYLDMLSSFLNISVQDTPLFNKEFFKLLLVREDQVIFDEGANPAADRFVHEMAEALARVEILQNKVYDPTAALMQGGGGYELGTDDIDGDEVQDYTLRFADDPTGVPGRQVGYTTEGNLLTYGVALTRFYVVNEDKPFQYAKVGYWLKITNSGSGNNRTFRIARILDAQSALLEGEFSLPDVNSGALIGEVQDSEFSPIEGFANRSVVAEMGGSFDDAIRRMPAEMQSWHALPPVGLGVRKGDIVRVLDEKAVPSVPTDLTVDLVRHEKLYIASETPVPEDAALIQRYVVLREPADPEVLAEELLFSETGIVKTASDGVLTYDGTEQAVKLTSSASVFEADDRQRFVTLSTTGTIQWTANLAYDGTLTHTGGAVDNPLARASINGSVTISGSSEGQNGTYTLAAITSETVGSLSGGAFIPETGLTITLNGVTNAGTYRVKKVLDAPGGNNLVLDLPACYPDPNNGAVTWRIHDGYQADVSPKTRLKRGSVKVSAAVGDEFTGGVREAQEGTDFQVNYETGVFTQIGRLAGTWGTSPVAVPHVDFKWYKEVLSETALVDAPIPGTVTDNINAATATITLDQVSVEGALTSTTGFLATAHEGLIFRLSGSSVTANNRDYLITEVVNTYTIKVYPPPASNITENFMTGEDGVYTQGTLASMDADDTEVVVTEVAFWAPDVLVDKFHLYNTYGYLIDRFEPSSETYREFIRGVFQLYMLGPTLERVESALNVISSLPVIRDDNEFLEDYDNTSDPNIDYVRTIRPDGELAEYEFPKGTPIRDDVTSYIPGTSPDLRFESFEPLTTLFEVTDHVQDPTWWDSIVIPAALMPYETVDRRTTVPVLYENTIGQIDDPRIGDPGFFIGADDEGVVPSWAQDLQLLRTYTIDGFDAIYASTRMFQLIHANFTTADEGRWIRVSGSSAGNDGDYQIDIVVNAFTIIVKQRPVADETGTFFITAVYYEDTTPAKRRKMANVVMNVFLKANMFFVRFDPLVNSILNPDFVEDLRELILIAKPGYKLAYIEPASVFLDIMEINEDPLFIDGGVAQEDALVVGEQGLTIQSGSWNIGDVWRRQGTPTLNIPLAVANGVTVPTPTALGVTNIIAARLRNVPPPPGDQVLEWRDYIINYKTGLLTPLTVWPACSATLDVSALIVSAQASKNAALGDTDYVIGANDPSRISSTRSLHTSGVLSTVNGDKILTDPNAEFLAGLHEGAFIFIHGRGLAQIWGVWSATQVLISRYDFADGSNLTWFPQSDEPLDGEVYVSGVKWFLKSPSANFRWYHVGKFIYVKKTLNPGYHYRIIDVPHMYEARLQQLSLPQPLLQAETDVMWQMRGGSERLGLVERPIQIAIS